MVKKVLLTVIALIIISAVAGTFYFKNLMKAPANLLQVKGSSASVSISWTKNEYSDRAAMLVPVRIGEIPDTLYMQFDIGAIRSVLYNRPLADLAQRYPDVVQADIPYLNSFDVQLDKFHLTYDSVKNINFGRPIEWNNKEAKIIIGTLGADFLERTKTILDFRHSTAFFFKEVPDSIRTMEKAKFEFKERRVLIPAVVDGDQKKLMWDTGASSYDLITSKDNFHELAANPKDVIVHETNQLDRKLKVYSAKSNKKMTIGNGELLLNSVTYVEGFPWYIHAAFYFSGMEGMIGNNLFRDKLIYLDAEYEEFLVF